MWRDLDDMEIFLEDWQAVDTLNLEPAR
jgi:hypothetical protein